MSNLNNPGPSSGFRKYLPDLDTPRFQIAKAQNPYEYADYFHKNHAPPWLYDLTRTWEKLLAQPYTGLSIGGPIKTSLFEHRDEAISMSTIVSAADLLLSKLDSSQATKLQHPLNSRAWRSWSNPEVLLRPLGLRLEELEEPACTAIFGLIRATLSPEGYEKALAAMRINGFLGELCGLPRIMNDLSYNFLLFGEPSETQPWGWGLYGHHLCLAVFLSAGQIVVSPTFTGAEPNWIDDGPFAGTEILGTEGDKGLALMRSLGDEEKNRARVYRELKDPEMRITGDLIEDRWNPDDQRHLCGAFRDNRDLPYEEGICLAEFTEEQKEMVLSIVDEFVIYLPEKARRLRLEDVKKHFSETWFSWIGGWGDEDAFYYRLQSPVIVVELDHHSGVFLSNKEPKKFHTHTIVRSPNGGDYGNALRPEMDKLL